MKTLKARMVVHEGVVSFFVDNGTFGEAKTKIENIFEFLDKNGLTFDEVLPVEQHAHDENGQHILVNEFQNTDD